MEPWSFEPAGRFDETMFESEALRRQPARRPVTSARSGSTFRPATTTSQERRYPTIYVIQGLTGQLDMWRNRSPFRRNFPELADELFATGGAPPAILVCVDAWTSLGGSQFLDSPGTGNYHTYLCDEVVPWVDATLPDARRPRPTAGSPASRAAATARWSRRCCGPTCSAGSRRMPATRSSRPATCRSSARRRARSATTTRARTSGSGRTSARGPRSSKDERLRPPQHLVHGGVLLGRRGRHGPPAVRRRHGRAGPGGLGALARLGPGADGPPSRPRRSARSRRSTSTPASATSTTSTSAPRPSAARSPTIGVDRRPLRALRRDAHGDRVPLPARPRLPGRAPRARQARGR